VYGAKATIIKMKRRITINVRAAAVGPEAA
jgi:hypothetical protein